MYAKEISFPEVTDLCHADKVCCVQIGLVNRILSVLTSDAADEAQERDAIALMQASLDPGALLEAGRLNDFQSALGCA